MDSCQLDQPLDLRLKALNLSLNPYEHQELGANNTSQCAGLELASHRAALATHIGFAKQPTVFAGSAAYASIIGHHQSCIASYGECLLPSHYASHHELPPCAHHGPQATVDLRRPPTLHVNYYSFSPTQASRHIAPAPPFGRKPPVSFAPDAASLHSQASIQAADLATQAPANLSIGKDSHPPTISVEPNSTPQRQQSLLIATSRESSGDWNYLRSKSIPATGFSLQRDSSSQSTDSASSSDSSSCSTGQMTRQYSLVSRYHCKPCGIVFSQPETLRAHQEGYCTKRERSQSQSQPRSKSALSPCIKSKVNIERE